MGAGHFSYNLKQIKEMMRWRNRISRLGAEHLFSPIPKRSVVGKCRKGIRNLLIKGGLGIGIQPDFQMSIAGGNEQIECDTKLSKKSAKLVLTALIER